MDLRIKSEDDRGGETGRSMVEMLGVLAVVGVLSVGGIAGYTYAMNKYYTNELLAGASERAVLVAAQIVAGQEPNLNEFAGHTAPGGTFGVVKTDIEGEFGIAVSGVKDAVCENLLKATDGTNVYIANDDETLSEVTCSGNNNAFMFVFETGIGVPEDVEKECNFEGNEKPGLCSKCFADEGAWIDSDELCGAGERCHDGNCVALEGEGCVKNSDCNDDEYCHYTSVDSDTCKPTQKGTCVKKADSEGDFASGTTAEADGFIRSRIEMNWFNAQNFCRSYGKNLVTLSQMGMGSALPSGKTHCSGNGGTNGCQINEAGWSAIRAKFGGDFYPWTANLVSGNSCGAFFVVLLWGDAYVDYSYRDSDYDYYYALCK